MWTRRIFPEPLLTVVKKNVELPTYTNILKRLKVGKYFLFFLFKINYF